MRWEATHLGLVDGAVVSCIVEGFEGLSVGGEAALTKGLNYTVKA